MAARYERVNAHDDDDPMTPTPANQRSNAGIPDSPPPSFHSRGSSLERRQAVNNTLADAFDTDGDDSDSDSDDRQRLVRSNPSSYAETPTSSRSASAHPAPPAAIPSPSSSIPGVVTPVAPRSTRIYGGGIQSDGVFSNLSAKPDRGGTEKDEQPPTYEQAAADQAPPYWETTILAPGLGGPDEVYIDGMPVGSVFSFFWNALISWSFQIVGFLLTYLLHSTHAAKNGSRVGLGITLIQFGFTLKDIEDPTGRPTPEKGPDGYSQPSDPNSHNFDPNNMSGDDAGMSGISGSEWLSYVLMVVGWFILIRGLNDYLHARRHEQLVLQSPDRGLGVAVVAEGESSERVV